MNTSPKGKVQAPQSKSIGRPMSLEIIVKSTPIKLQLAGIYKTKKSKAKASRTHTETQREGMIK
jgi:hypothetical protein